MGLIIHMIGKQWNVADAKPYPIERFTQTGKAIIKPDTMNGKTIKP
jgi:hypothetical protein